MQITQIDDIVMAKYYSQGIEEVLAQLNTSENEGLTTAEAKRRQEEYGYNLLEEKGRKNIIMMFFAQFKSLMIIILLVAAAISGVVGVMEGEGLLDTFVILGILVVNALIGAIQEKKAETSLEALKSMAAPASKVLRDGTVRELATRDLVPGDVVILETGSVIPADLRLSEAVNLKVQESSLTGESVPVNKQTEPIPGEDISLGDRTNMVYSGSMVTYGRGRGIVVSTGMKTEVGKIANMLQHAEDTDTPMSRRLNQLGKVLGLVALGICGLIFVVGVLYGNSVLSMFMTAVTLAVAAIPEGLPAVSTIVLAIGVQRMVKKNAIIRTLPSVETLGSATVICSDKTGTLTQNKMTVVEAFVNHKHDQINRSSPGSTLNDEEERLLAISVLCADAYIKKDEDGTVSFTGDPTETALLDFGLLYGVHKDEVEKKFPRVAEIPFDSERKRMTTVNRMSESSTRVNVKGGLDEVLGVCDKIVINGDIRPLTQGDTAEIRNANETMANSALRVLAMAYKDLPEAPQKVTIGEMENGLIFIGLLGMIDPARPEVLDAVAKCNTAGIRPVMITGDHKTTALAIAREIGIYKDGDIAITGSELEKLSDEELNETVFGFSVYARVAPEHKVRIVKAWQSHSEVVAMTGDGVNDAPALKQADIGAAMGIVGTDVAKGAADMILTDDNFATIVSAVEEGRRIYDNILKVIQYLLSTNVGEIFLILVTSIFNMGMPLLPIHILWINLVTDSLPALALSVDPPEKGIMNRKPRNPKGGFMTKGMIWRVMYQGLMIGCIPLVSYILGLHDGGEELGRTMAFATLMFAQLVHVRNLHSNESSSFLFNPLRNKPLILAIFASAVIGLIVLLVPPIREAFSLAIMDREHWIIVILMAFAPIPVVELFKLFRINGVKSDEK
ncbi:MAG: calcium-translocating P-type ATPase, PMCA-type [Bacteroidales bacterium]|nr:calcium-translocating P-type ATPase, PMCA-type [Bacteroidales bacterium]